MTFDNLSAAGISAHIISPARALQRACTFGAVADQSDTMPWVKVAAMPFPTGTHPDGGVGLEYIDLYAAQVNGLIYLRMGSDITGTTPAQFGPNTHGHIVNAGDNSSDQGGLQIVTDTARETLLDTLGNYATEWGTWRPLISLWANLSDASVYEHSGLAWYSQHYIYIGIIGNRVIFLPHFYNLMGYGDYTTELTGPTINGFGQAISFDSGQTWSVPTPLLNATNKMATDRFHAIPSCCLSTPSARFSRTLTIATSPSPYDTIDEAQAALSTSPDHTLILSYDNPTTTATLPLRIFRQTPTSTTETYTSLTSDFPT